MRRSRAFAALLVVSVATFALAGDKAKAKKALEEAVIAGSSDGVQKACDDLIECGGKDALQAILAIVPKVEGAALYWQLVGGASGFKDKPALEEFGKQIIANQGKGGIARDLLFALQNNRSPEVVTPLALILEKGKYDLQLMAVDQLAQVRTPAAAEALQAALKREAKGDPELRGRIESALAFLDSKPEGEKGDKAGRTAEKPRDGEFQKTVEKLPPKRIIVLASQGDFDHMEAILEKHKIPHTVVKRPEFEAEPQKYLEGCYAMLVNCSGDKLKQPSNEAIRAWVEDAGGFLYTEDWSFDVTTACWPDKVKQPGNVDECHVKLAPGRGNTSHPLMRGVWQKPAVPAKKDEAEGKGTTEKVESPAKKIEHSWQVDGASALISVVDKTSVLVLLESEELGQKASGNTAVAITFRVGTGGPKKQATGGEKHKGTGEWSPLSKGGRVLHTLSHWGHQPTTEDGEALHNMLLNFLLEAAKRHEPPAPKK